MFFGKQKYKELRKELQRSQEIIFDLETFIKEFSSFLPLPVCNINPLRIIIDINGAFQDLTKHTATKIVGERIEAVFLEKEKIKEIIDEASKKQIVKDRELTLLSKSNEEIPVNIACSARKNIKGDVLGYFLAIIDIRESKKFTEELEKKVQQRTKELQERVEELEKFRKLTVGRELKMIELKKEIEEFKKTKTE